mmetsp:Transcript_7157/g.16265  ORF Transcript_7157/g.16265 Transcript_7157/m.16265 type:complete len:93 (+) Transcript_7157:559-837(+)
MFKGDRDSSDDKNNVAFRQMLQTTGTDGSKIAPKASSKKKRSLADCLVNATPNLGVSATSRAANSTSSTAHAIDPTTVNDSASSVTTIVNAN